MSFKTKTRLLLAAAASLFVLYILSFITDPIQNAERRSRTALLEDADKSSLTRIAISSEGRGGRVTLVLQEGQWRLDRQGALLPVKQGRVEDFITSLGTKAAYPVRARGTSFYKDFGLSSEQASRLALYKANTATPFLDLYIGSADAEGTGVYLRKEGTEEVFSGPDTLTPYIDGGEGSWLDLRLFQGSKTLHAESIQRIIVSSRFDPPSGLQERSYTLARSVARPWILEGNEGLVLDSRKVETYAKAIAEAESDDFAFEKDFEVQASIRLETGNAQSYQIILGPPFQERFRLARLASSERVFLLSHWTVESLFPSLESLSTSNNAVSYEKSP